MAKRLIDAEDVKELLKGLDSLPWEEEVDVLVDRLETIELPVRDWIPCSERLPEGCDDAEIEVLISTHEAYPDALFEETGFALYYPKTKSFHSVYGNRLEITEIVTAWQYLPEPYIRKKVE